VRVTKVLRHLLGLHRDVVVGSFELPAMDAAVGRPRLVVQVRLRSRHRARCGRCGAPSPLYDRGAGMRRCRHVDVGFGRASSCARPLE